MSLIGQFQQLTLEFYIKMTKKLILIRGLVRESRHWGDVPSKLQKILPQLEVITPDLPGVGVFHHLTSPNNFDEMIHFIRKTHQSQIEDGGHIILAMSLGGMLAKRWSELYPHDFQKMILANTSFKGINPLLQRLQPKAILTFMKLFFLSDVSKRELGILQLVSNATERYAEIHSSWDEIQKSAPVSKKSFINQMTAALNFKPNISAPKAKLLILAGEKDRLCDVACSKKLHELWKGEIKIHPTAGHDLPIDAPDWFIEQVKNFLHP